MSGVTEWVDSAARAEIIALLTNILDMQNSGFIVARTWAEASGFTLTNKAGVKIYGPDTGTHTDPGGGTVPNTGTFQYRTDGTPGLYRVGELELTPPIRFDMGTVATSNPMIRTRQDWNDGLVPGDGGRQTFHGLEFDVGINNTNKIRDLGTSTIARFSVNSFYFAELHPPTKGVFTGGNCPTELRFYDPQKAGHTSFGGISYSDGIFNITQGIDSGTGVAYPILSFFDDNFNPDTGAVGGQVVQISTLAQNRLQFFAPNGAFVFRNKVGRIELETVDVNAEITIVSYILTDGNTANFVNAGHVSGQARTPIAMTTVLATCDIMNYGTMISPATTRTNLGKIDGAGNIYAPSFYIGATIGATVRSGAAAPATVTNGDLRIVRSAASRAKIDNGAGAFGFLHAKLQTDTAATLGTITPDRYLVIYDSAGTAHKIPASL